MHHTCVLCAPKTLKSGTNGLGHTTEAVTTTRAAAVLKIYGQLILKLLSQSSSTSTYLQLMTTADKRLFECVT